MRWLIDGYNVMHAAGLLGAKLGREGFRRARRRFLNELADVLQVEHGGDVTVVFDASVPPGDFPIRATYRGMHLVFAVGDENADARIEHIIGHDSNPKTLTVVSSDHRIRQAAVRRRARPFTSDAFWDHLDNIREAPPITVVPRPAPQPPPAAEPSGSESAFWLEVFREVDDLAGADEILSPRSSLLTDAEIAEIQRQVDLEG